MDKKNEKIEKIEDVTTQKTEKIAGEIKKEEKKEEKVKAKEILGEVNIVPEVIATIISRNFIGDQRIRKRDKC